MASGLKQVETNSSNVQRLLHIKGKRNVVAGEVCSPLGCQWGALSRADMQGGVPRN